MDGRHGHGTGKPESPYEPRKKPNTEGMDDNLVQEIIEATGMTRDELDRLSPEVFNVLKNETEAYVNSRSDEENQWSEEMREEGHVDDYINFHILVNRLKGGEEMSFIERMELSGIIKKTYGDLGFDLEIDEDGKAIYTPPKGQGWKKNKDGKWENAEGKSVLEVMEKYLFDQERVGG